MRGAGDDIVFLRYVPDHLRAGLARGLLALHGSVIRVAEGEGKGRIVGFLIEGPGLRTAIEHGGAIDPAPLAQHLGSESVARAIVSGVGILNLGVQVEGSALILRRLERIAAAIDAARGDLERIGEDLRYLHVRDMAKLRADARHALEMAERGLRRGDRSLLDAARNEARPARNRLVGTLDAMRQSRRIVAQRALFEELFRFAAVTAHLEARLDEALEGPEQAARDLARIVADLARVAEAYRDALDPERYLRELLMFDSAARQDAKACRRRLDVLVARLDGHVAQLELQAALNLDAESWRKRIEGAGDAPIVCITSERQPTADLIEAARRPALPPPR